MANTHNVTVFIWRNSFANDVAADKGEKLSGDSSQTGHAAMKLQEVGAGKGDYHYLSFWPGRHPITQGKFHSMTGRLGPKSLDAANTTLLADWQGVSQSGANHVWQTKRFATSLDFAKEFDQPMPGYPALGGSDMDSMQRKPDLKFRINGLAMVTMISYVKKITAYFGDDATGVPFHIRDFNCATAVAQCLAAGGAPDMPQREVWSPNRLADWCRKLVAHYKGEIIEKT